MLGVDTGTSSDSVTIAEMSWPKHHIQEWLGEQKRWKTTYHAKNFVQPPRQMMWKFSRTMNWFQPIFWTVIIEVAATVGWLMSPTEIVKGCQMRSKNLFHSLCADIICKWIDHTGPHPCWSNETLAKVARENCPGGGITERGILVS